MFEYIIDYFQHVGQTDWFLDGLDVSGFANHPMSSYNEGMELVGTIEEPARRGRPGVGCSSQSASGDVTRDSWRTAGLWSGYQRSADHVRH